MTGTRDSRNGAWLSDALQDRAQSHDPDLARITARFERLTDGRATYAAPRRRMSGPMRVRLLGIPLGIAAALTSATLAVAVSVGIAVSASPHLTVPVATPKTSAAPTTAAPSSPAPSSAPAVGPTSVTTSATGSSVATGRLATAAWVDSHSTEYWVQEDLNFTSTSVIKQLRITVTVSGGSAVASTGVWTTMAAANLETTVSRVSGGLEYEITLKPGQSLPADLNRLGFQFNRPASGHDFALDTYSINATTADGATLGASGTFGG
jgi:hypothetical protein